MLGLLNLYTQIRIKDLTLHQCKLSHKPDFSRGLTLPVVYSPIRIKDDTEDAYKNEVLLKVFQGGMISCWGANIKYFHLLFLCGAEGINAALYQSFNSSYAALIAASMHLNPSQVMVTNLGAYQATQVSHFIYRLATLASASSVATGVSLHVLHNKQWPVLGPR